jgi:hypothetical protein
VRICCYVWKPSNGTKYSGYILDGSSAATVDESAAGLNSYHIVQFSGSAVSGLTSGDAVIVFEWWNIFADGSGPSGNNYYYFDGSTDTYADGDTVTANASSYIETPENLAFSPPANHITKTLDQETVTIGASTLTLARGKARSRTETVIAVTETSKTRLAAKIRAAPSQTVSISDAPPTIVKAKNVSKTISSETVDASDQAPDLLRKKARAPPGETVTIAETSSTRLAAKQRAPPGETVSISDDLDITQRQKQRAPPGQTVTIGENVSREVSTEGPKNVEKVIDSESITVDDSPNRRAAKWRQLG